MHKTIVINAASPKHSLESLVNIAATVQHIQIQQRTLAKLLMDYV